MITNAYSKEECWAVPCKKPSTHTLTSRVLSSEHFEPFIQKTDYCLDCAKHFAFWLIYAYTEEFEILDISEIRSGNATR